MIQKYKIPKEEGITRRQFFRYSWLVFLGGVLVNALGSFVVFFWPQKTGAFGGKVLAGRVDEFPLTSITRNDEGHFYVSHVPDGYLAFWWRCTHLGCTVPWRAEDRSEDKLAEKGRFNCPCHGSIYDRYGVVKGGPAPRPLDLFPIEVVDGKLMVDTGKVLQREEYKPQQATKA